ncbi:MULTISPECIES: DUF1700 domain-containing protein [Paraliobacillus]|uniref:DUF1700 domain-containing protein n=1 Tax=Paraliobacillus TaxID=200903 RepID=UPI000DD48133|nr:MULTISPECIES: DUF1700 domain-containing protein [Paraliobacillus]
MDKRGFMRELDYHLRDLSISERKDILEDYTDHFKIGEIDGKTEQDVVLELGSPFAIAQSRLATSQHMQMGDEETTTTYERKSPTHLTRSFIIGIILFLINLIVVAGPAVALFSIWLSGWAVAISFTLAPVAWIVSLFIQSDRGDLATFFIVLTLTSIGVLIGIAMIPITKLFYRLTMKYILWNVRMIRG